LDKIVLIEFNDVHWRLENPKARIDNYREALEDKLYEIYSIANDNAADGILIPGDISDTPGLSTYAISELTYVLSQSPCPIYTIAGQHDEYSHSPFTLKRTPYGLARKLGFIRDVADYPEIIQQGHIKVSITGRHYDFEADEPGYYELPNPPIKDCYNVHLAHGLVLDSLPPEGVRHTLLQNLKTSADLICVGDYHGGLGIKKVGNTIFCNPGALGRVSAKADELFRPIQVAILTFTEEGITAELVPLKCARPGIEVLSREHIEQAAAAKARTNEFLELLAMGGEMNAGNMQQIVDLICNREGISEEVRAEALRRLSREKDGGGKSGKGAA